MMRFAEIPQNFLQKATKETKIEINFQNLRYLRFLLLLFIQSANGFEGAVF
jgi:hypothetical protein